MSFYLHKGLYKPESPLSKVKKNPLPEPPPSKVPPCVECGDARDPERHEQVEMTFTKMIMVQQQLDNGMCIPCAIRFTEDRLLEKATRQIEVTLRDAMATGQYKKEMLNRPFDPDEEEPECPPTSF